jgi:hypothetical protein
MIKPWLFEFFPELGDEARDPAPAEMADYATRYLDLWARDEALGFEGIFFSEHHFGGSFSASPNLLIAAVAQRTRKLRLGVRGVCCPIIILRASSRRSDCSTFSRADASKSALPSACRRNSRASA